MPTSQSTAPTEIEAYLQPPPAEALVGASVIVLDILRATTVHAALAAGGARQIYPVADFASGTALRNELLRESSGETPDCRLIGEIGALPPPEADFGNSPTEFASLDVDGWTVVHVTSNGTRALLGASQADRVLSGCLRNMSASVVELMRHNPTRVAIVCSGDHGGTAPSVEDSFAAGAYVAHLRRTARHVTLRGGARLALKLFYAYSRSPTRAFAESPHADHLRRLDYEADLVYASAIDADSTAVALGRDASGRPVLERVPTLLH